MSFASPTFGQYPLSRGASHARPRYAKRRGTRGFLAFVLTLVAAINLGLGAVALPTMHLGQLALSWLIPLTLAFGIAHLVAAVAVIRDRPWASSLALYLAAIGLGVVAFGLLASLTGADPFAATSGLPAAQARADGLGFLVWMLGMWAVTARYALWARR